jgi:outer membrane protein assembly factor BamB
MAPRALPALSRLVAALVLVLAAIALPVAPAWAVAPLVSVSPMSGPPGTTITVRGSGFAPRETVDLYFDATDEALGRSSGSGAFTASVTVPASAAPGTHWVTAEGRRSTSSAQAMFTVQTNWPQFRNGPTHRGYNTTENVLTPANVSGLDLAWSYTAGDGVTSSPAVANGVVYVGSDDHKLYAFNAATGALLWSFTTGGTVHESPAVANGRVYVGSDDHKVYALNAATGALIWSYPTGGQVASPAVANGLVYVGGSFDHKVYALNAATGALIWSYTTGDSVASSPAVANGVVYIGSDDHKVYALNAATGALLWSYPTGNNYVDSAPAVANGVVYVSSGVWPTVQNVHRTVALHRGAHALGPDFYAHKVYALNAVTGALLWSYTTYFPSSPAVADGVVYIGSGDHNVYALDAVTGALLWSYTTGNYVYSSPAVADGVVYIGSDDHNVYAFGLAGGTNAGLRRPDPTALRPNPHLQATPAADRDHP